MKGRASWRIALAVLTAVFLAASPAGAVTACESLASLAHPNAKIDSAGMAPGGAFAQRGSLDTAAGNEFRDLRIGR